MRVKVTAEATPTPCTARALEYLAAQPLEGWPSRVRDGRFVIGTPHVDASAIALIKSYAKQTVAAVVLVGTFLAFRRRYAGWRLELASTMNEK